MKRTLVALTLFATLGAPSFVEARAPSVCPYSMSDRAAATRTFRTLGTNMEFARICRVGGATIDRTIGEMHDTAQPCLQALGVKATDIKAAMDAGVVDAQDEYRKVVDTSFWCESIRQHYAQ
ncbi:hypothetical protein BH09PSE6_BH09PSE6_12830 [soil metagenome]